MENQNNAPALQDKNTVIYQVAGEEVKLSYNIVRNFLTRGNGNVTDQELTQFIAICKFNKLNPFLNEAYLVKYNGANASATMIVSKEALMKRAEQCAEYDGFRAGLIIKRDNQILDIEGSFTMPDDELLGGWAEVHRKDRKYAVISRIAMKEYDKKQSVWNEKKATMIRKTAIVQAMREAFPTQLGAMYTAEEQGAAVQDAEFEEIKTSGKTIQPIEAEEMSFDAKQAQEEAITNNERKTPF